MAKKSTARQLIRMVSTGLTEKGKKTGYFYTTSINKRNRQEKGDGKLIIKKFDPRAYNKETKKIGMMIDFKEDKIK